MKFCIRVTIHAGPRTKTAVSAYSIAANPKTIKFANGETVTSAEIEKWLGEQLTIALEAIKNKSEVTDEQD